MIKKLLILLILASTAFGSGNIEISDGELKIETADSTEYFRLYRDNINVYMNWTDGNLFMLGGPIDFGGENFVNVGNITGDDIDINAGTGDYTSTGIVSAGTLTDGSLSITAGDIINVNSMLFDLSPVVTPAEGLLYWDVERGTASLGMPGGNVTLQIGQEGLIHVRNESGADIANGKLVYTTGSSGNKLTIGLADNTDSDKMFILGMATETIANNTNGYVALWGNVSGETGQPIDTSAYPEGTKLYMNSNGNWQDTHPPDATYGVIVIGQVSRQHAVEGAIELLSPQYFTLGNNYDGTLRQSIINQNTGTSSATAFTAINNAGHRVSWGIGGSNHSRSADTAILYNQGYGETWNAVDGNHDFVWFTDPTDSHDFSAINNEVMRLSAAGILNLYGNLDMDGNNIVSVGVLSALGVETPQIGSSSDPDLLKFSLNLVEVGGCVTIEAGCDLKVDTINPFSTADTDLIQLAADEVTVNGDIVVNGDGFFDEFVFMEQPTETDMGFEVKVAGVTRGRFQYFGGNTAGQRYFGIINDSGDGGTRFFNDTGPIEFRQRSIKNFHYIDFYTQNTASVDKLRVRLKNHVNKSFFQIGHDDTYPCDLLSKYNSRFGDIVIPTETVEVNGTSVFGDGGTTDYSKFEADGTLEFNGAATVWDDWQGPLTSNQLLNPSAHIVRNSTESSLTYKNNADLGDYVYMNPQMQHKWELGTNIHPHIHWWQTTSAVPNWLVQYRWQRNGQAKTTAWTDFPLTTSIFTYVSGTLGQITGDPTGIAPPTGYSVSDIIQLRIIRDVVNASGAFAGAEAGPIDTDAVSVDFHYEIDTIGSRDEFAK